ncbi:uncharacterized protein LOC142606117 [Castanea sativa]|uniref:uncharacterized protein LOC142606117 n=1 Tax=Castanea sativa TaxID=21020 RepID=UPI003F64ACD1
MAIEMGISQLKIFGDSKLIISQILEQYDIKKEDLIPYCKYAKKLLANFEAITLEHIPRKENRQADALAHLATAIALSQEETTKVAISQRLLDDKRNKTKVQRRAARFIYYKDTLFHRSFDGLFLRCLGENKAKQALEEAHSGICGAYQLGPKLHYRIKRMSYYWPTMGLDAIGPLPESSSGHLYILAATDYFSKWTEAVPLKEVKKKRWSISFELT